MRTIILAAAIIAAPIAQAEIYKCVVDDKTTFSQVPCASDAVAVEPQYAVPPPGAALDQARINQQIQKLAHQHDLRQLREKQIAEGKVGIGMTPEEVTRSWGSPTKVNRSVYASGVKEQWVYRRSGSDAQYVYFQDGVVVAIN